jgi:succinate dehydrogenase / fumarate reductase flavoprotein subunit
MSNIPGLYVLGEANFSDHGANRLGASALMQGLADGYFVLPYTIGNYLSNEIKTPRFKTDLPEFDEAEKNVRDELTRMMETKGKRSVDDIHRELGHIMWEHCGMGRTEKGLKEGIEKVKALKEEFRNNLLVLGEANGFNEELFKAGHLSDFIELGEVMMLDALNRNESCGGHFRIESQTPEGEALRDDINFAYVANWLYKGDGITPELVKEELKFETVELKQRNYK